MNSSKKHTNYMDFLSDDDFIQWILTGDETLEGIWKEYIRNNPETEEEFNRAVHLARKIKLTDNRLGDKEFILLHGRIQDTYRQINRKKKVRSIIGYAAVACMAAVLLSVVYLAFREDSGDIGRRFTEDMIVGQNLEAEDISLITSSGKSSFSKDINLEVNESGSMYIKDADGEKETTVTPEKETMNRLVVPYGKRSFVSLPDGTQVWVNSGSVLEFPSRFTGNKREISLKGEIYLEVAADTKKPFLVNTPEMQVKVYGTKFNVSSYFDNSPSSVVLVEGKVSVKTSDTDEKFMAPNEKVTYTNNLLVKEQVDVSRYIAWKEGYLILDHTPITEVLQQVGRYYNLTFNLGNNIDLRSRTCTGKIYLSPSLDNVMTTISLLSSTGYSREENKIYINLKEDQPAYGEH